MFLEKNFFPLVIVVISSFFFFFFFRIFFYKIKVLDKTNKRKIHKGSVAIAGGAGIISTLFVLINLLNFDESILKIITLSTFIFAIGFLDDLYKINPGSRIIFQSLIAYFIFFEGFQVQTLGNYSYLGTLDLGSFSLFFTIICFLICINSTNYFDGADGLCSLISISTFINLTIYNYQFLNLNNNFLLEIILILIIYLFFNFGFFNQKKIFLGDGGSTMIGFIIACKIIFFVNLDKYHPISGLFYCPILFFELLSLKIDRFNSNKKIFKADKDHIHHYLIKRYGLSQCLAWLSLSNLLLSALMFKLYNFLASFQLLIFYIGLFIIFFSIRQKIKIN